ncbi:MAG TPA: hypothetical protein VFO03_00740 [Gaiellaceae bacterium]|nr:hypothetical protein [Gaiellaceae bacterium]
MATEPLRDAILADAHATAERVLARADEQAEAKLRDAERRGRALVERARAEGIAAAAIVGAHEEARARRIARAAVLAARRELYEDLGRRARSAARELRTQPGYEALLDRLAAGARAQLGPAAEIERDPPDSGGIRASSGARHVDYTLNAIADRCLEQLGAGVEELWR